MIKAQEIQNRSTQSSLRSFLWLVFTVDAYFSGKTKRFWFLIKIRIAVVLATHLGYIFFRNIIQVLRKLLSFFLKRSFSNVGSIESSVIESRKRYGEENFSIEHYSVSVSFEKNVFFLHIPKTAGVSLCYYLYNNLGRGHETLQELNSIQKIPEKSRRFTVIRCPVDRFISAFNYFIAMHGYKKSVNEFVQECCFIKDTKTVIHFLPQICFISPIGQKVVINEIILFENLSTVFPDLSKKNVTRKENNTSVVLAKKEELTEESLAIINKYYADDVWLYNKAKEMNLLHIPVEDNFFE